MKNSIKKPNILFIITDDQGEWAVESEKNRDIKTPNLKRLANQGVTFDEFYCTSPVCSPARASIVTGKIPSCHGVQDWLKKGNLDAYKYPNMAELPGFDMTDKAIDYLKDHKTYIQYLADNGYNCALSGKWHLGDNITRKKGFKYYFTIGRGGCHYYQADIFDNNTLSISNEYITDTITNHALDYLEKMSNEHSPFYLSVHYTAPHSPWDASEHPKEYLDWYKDCEFKDTPNLPVHPWQVNTCPIGDTEERRKENLRGYYAAISAMDAGVGKILDKVKEKGLEDNTIVIFTSDNGMNMGHHGIWGKGNGTYPPNMYESSIRVPFIIKIPDCSNPGTKCSAMASQYDIFPTILELAGCKFELEPMQPGKSLLKQINNPLDHYDDRVVVFDEYSKTRMIKKNKFKYVHRYGNGPCEFYNLSNDPDEKNNLFGNKEYDEIIKTLKTDMEEWFDRYSTPEMDARKYDATGRGQDKMCYEEGAFDQSLEFYHESKQF